MELWVHKHPRSFFCTFSMHYSDAHLYIATLANWWRENHRL
jgi:hypothetical protein